MQRPGTKSRTASPPASPEDNDHWRRHNIGRLLSDALWHFEERVIERLEQAGHLEVTQSHINATRHIDASGTRLTEMAQRAAMTKQSMSELVAQLENKGLVTRIPDPTDGRARLVRFTPRGQRWLRDFRDAVLTTEAEMAQQVGAAALATTKEALMRYRSHTEQDVADAER